MKKFNIIILLLFTCLFYVGCNKYTQQVGVDIDYLYSHGLAYLSDGELSQARESFQQIVDEYPYKDEAVEAQVFIIWIYYLEDDYVLAEVEMDAFLKYYLSNDYTEWVNYMQALLNYEQMRDTKRESSYAIQALSAFNDIYRNAATYTQRRDAAYKIEIIKHNLARRNMEIAFYYLKHKDYFAAINRYQDMIKIYNDTAFVQEGLYRLAYVWTVLGDHKEAFRVASVLGYNYPNSIWYAKTFSLLNDYSELEDIKNKRLLKNKENISK